MEGLKMTMWQKFCAWLAYVCKQVADASAQAELQSLGSFLKKTTWPITPPQEVVTDESDGSDLYEFDRTDARRAHLGDADRAALSQT